METREFHLSLDLIRYFFVREFITHICYLLNIKFITHLLFKIILSIARSSRLLS